MDFGDFSTKRELDALVRDLRTFNDVFRYVTVGVYLLYLVYRFVAGQGYLVVNIVLAVATIAYLGMLVFFSVRQRQGKNTDAAHTSARRVYRAVKLTAVAFSAVISILGILSATERPDAFSIVLAILLPVCLVLQIVFDVFLALFSLRVARFKAALSADMEVLKRDMAKIVFDLLKNSLLHKGEKKQPEAEEEGDELIVVGSDDPASVRMMRKETDGAQKRGLFSRFFGKKKNREEKVEK